ncbi:MAG: dihydrolipoamide acetyltransferase [Chthonomonadaceae bacterium]|nr:dihydrolipoamide acetyltransferase [Chthonomonadaceae bacterium]
MAPLKDILIPELGMTTDEVAISEWLKQPGDAVRRGEPIVELVTDKASIELEASDAGTLAEVLVAPGETIPVGTVIGRLDLDLAGAVKAPPPATPAALRAPEEPAAPASLAAATPNGNGRAAERVRATPIARRMAQRHGIELHTIQGSGPEGRIRRADVESVLAEPVARAPAVAPESVAAAVPAPERTGGARRGVERITLSDRQRRLAGHLTRSAAVPQFSVARDIDLTAVLGVPKGDGVSSFSDVLIKSVAMTLRSHRHLNASMEEGELAVWDDINIGLAVAVGPDLHVPVIRNADSRAIVEVGRDRKELTRRAREGTLRLADTADGTFTISNMGTLGVTDVHAIITPPQVSILGVGAPVARIVPTGRGTEVRQLAGFRMTCDHRAVNGAAAALFLAELAARLSNPFTIGEVSAA